ncbi:MAG: hypothetical protein EB027_01955 [Actinobacteria bacterium]|nr:hypothetical protein [Actinomycetota bacterium]
MCRVLRVLGWSALAVGCVLAAGAQQHPSGATGEPAQVSLASPALRAPATAAVALRSAASPDPVMALAHSGSTPRSLLNRVVCDNQREPLRIYWCEVTDIRGPSASTIGRAEGEPASGSLDEQVHLVYDLLGFTSDYYTTKFGYDLTDNIGLGVQGDPAGTRTLSATVNACGESNPSCNDINAYWMPAPPAGDFDTYQLIGGSISISAGLAGISDVIAHELQHGVTDVIAGLAYQGQAGAINESISDVFGELVDRAKQRKDYGAIKYEWTIGDGYTWSGIASQPVPFLRSLSDPYGKPTQTPTRLPGQAASCRGWQPDRMSSPCWDIDPKNEDYGGVHTNSGVGNKLAHLISAGGTFNGHKVVGIGDDATAKLWWDVLPRLSSNADYYELGNDLAVSCASLAAKAALPVNACASTVKPAIRATEIANRRVTFSRLPAKVKAGATIKPIVRVGAWMRSDLTVPMYGQTTYLQMRSGGRWVAIAKARTDASGVARFSARIRSTGVYRLALASNQVIGEGGGTRVTIRVS